MFLFMMTSLDGYMEGENHDLSWHNVDKEFNTFAVEQLREADTIVFGRRTYQLMESFWPSKEGQEDDPVVASLMNEIPKVVFSKSLDNVVETDTWKHVTLFHDNIEEEVRKLKNVEGLPAGRQGKSIVVLGSNNFCVTLLELGLLDELRIMVNPVVLGKGTPLFTGITDRYKFTLTNSQIFGNGNILLTYKPEEKHKL
jgi:dihydrofolate reductase